MGCNPFVLKGSLRIQVATYENMLSQYWSDGLPFFLQRVPSKGVSFPLLGLEPGLELGVEGVQIPESKEPGGRNPIL